MLTDQKKTHRMSVRHCPYNMKLFLASVSAQIFYFVLIFLGGGWVAVLSSMWDLSSSTSKVWSLNHWTFRKIPQIFFKANDGFKEYTSQTLCSQLFFFKKKVESALEEEPKELCLGSPIFRVC